MDGYWAKAPMCRDQFVLFSPTLESVLGEAHSARFFETVTEVLDWSEWESVYSQGGRGQPPIHPKIMAVALLYGLHKGIRSSRQLEDACINRVDFKWLVEGRQIDHSTFARFRKRFKGKLRGLMKQVLNVAADMKLLNLLEVGIDATRVRANNGNDRTRTAKWLAERKAKLEAELADALDRMGHQDTADDQLFGPDGSPNRLPKELQSKNALLEQVKKSLESAEASDASKKKKGRAKKDKASQAPVTDPDCKVLPNKEGGFAPNYTPMAMTDGNGLILDADVINDSSEAALLQPSLDRVEEAVGSAPESVYADGAYGTGHNLAAMEDREIELLSPVSRPSVAEAAARPDPRKPVAEEKRKQLPLYPKSKTLTRSCFIYDAEEDCYWCPMGQRLPKRWRGKTKRECGDVRDVTYISEPESCVGCPLRDRCLGKKTGLRRIKRDEHEEHRERLEARMATEDCASRYAKRAWIAETPFGHMKQVMRFRQFLLRGMENVKAEWMWACIAYNLGKIVRLKPELLQAMSRLKAA